MDAKLFIKYIPNLKWKKNKRHLRHEREFPNIYQSIIKNLQGK